jgi:LmbE family N-acetylglucosaminyl deacetylase
MGATVVSASVGTSVLVVSPHLDDAVLSLGATMASMTRRGLDVHLLTVFAGDPRRDTAPSRWDARRNVATASEATAMRRDEDDRAARLLGVRTTWLPFDDVGYLALRDPDVVWAALQPHVATASLVLVPGFPLEQADHRFTTMLVLDRMAAARAADPTDRHPPVYFYGELPYALSPFTALKAAIRRHRASPVEHWIGSEVLWRSPRPAACDRHLKHQAMECYAHEIDGLGHTGAIMRLHQRTVSTEFIGAAVTDQPPAFLLDRPT